MSGGWLWLLLWGISLPLAGFLVGVDRRLTARLQGRVGPPLLQPFWDVGKLLGKRGPMPAPRQALWAAGYPVFLGVAAAETLAGQNLLLIVFLLGLATACLAVAGFVGPSPYSQLGAQRQLFLGLIYEPILLLWALGVRDVTGHFALANAAAAFPPLVLRLPLFLPGLLIALAVAWRKSPFDLASSAHAHQELVAGLASEMGGGVMALVELGHWWELALFLFLIFLMGYPSLFLGLALVTVFYLGTIFLDNLLPRLTWRYLWPVGWAAGLGGGILNLAWLALTFR